MTYTSSFFRAGACAALLSLAALPGTLAAQSLEGSKWSIDQEGVDAPVLWWLGSQGRVRTGDIGTILPGYRWVQKEDSVIVSVGDTVRYAGVLMANRLVGVRTGPRRQEGWWSGARTDGAAAVAQAPTTPTTPATDPSTQPMSRPADPVTTAPTSTPTSTQSNPPAGGRTLRRIEREGATTPASNPAPAAGEGREIRRLPRPGRAAAATDAPPSTAAAPVSAADFVGRWSSHNPNLRLHIEISADSTFTFTSRNGERHPGRWTIEGAALLGEIDLTTEGTKPVLITREGEGLKLQARGSLLYILMDRAPAGSSLEPAVRQP